jgi:prepilin-type N-terminal cleavage/methylation domain-containing protein
VIRQAFTLIEMLAVIVIIAMVATAVTVSLAAADDQAAFLNGAAQCRDLDAKARQCAQTQGSAALIRVGDDHNTIALEVGQERLAVAKMPSSMSVHLERDRPVTMISFDRAGRSPDYKITICRDDRSRSRGWKVCGLTGFLIEEPTS